MSRQGATHDTASASRQTADEIIAVLSDAGASVLFGLPGGGPNLDLIGAAQRAGLRFVLTHGESAATIMAAVHSELTGSLGVSVFTRGPGLASAVNGIGQALLDRQAVVAIADSVPTSDRPRISHQLIDQSTLASGVAKETWTVGLGDAIASTKEAVLVATAIPRGPVVLNVDPASPGGAGRPRPASPPRPEPDRAVLTRVLRASRRPVVVLGLGALPHVEVLRRVLLGAGCPVLSTYKAKGILPDSAAETAGLLTGASIEAPLLAEADLVIGVGLDPVEMIPAAWNYPAPVLLLDEWNADPGEFYGPATVVLGPLADLITALGSLAENDWPEGAGRAARLAARELLLGIPASTPGSPMTPHEVVVAARAVAPAGTIATVDAGAHMIVAMPLFDVEEPGEVLISSGFATMGFALPAAIAATLARPGRHCVCLTGDGGLQMCLAELETAARLELPVIVVVFNDAALSLIAVKQRPEGHGGSAAVRYGRTDFATVATGLGVPGVAIGDPATLRAELALALARRGPSLLDVAIDPAAYRDVIEVVRGETGRRGRREHSGSST